MFEAHWGVFELHEMRKVSHNHLVTQNNTTTKMFEDLIVIHKHHTPFNMQQNKQKSLLNRKNMGKSKMLDWLCLPYNSER